MYTAAHVLQQCFSSTVVRITKWVKCLEVAYIETVQERGRKTGRKKLVGTEEKNRLYLLAEGNMGVCLCFDVFHRCVVLVLFIEVNNVKSTLSLMFGLKKKTLITKKRVNKSLCNDVNLHSFGCFCVA